MFKNIFFLGISSGILATIACLVYTNGYFSIIVDFSEAAGFVNLLSYCIAASMVASFLFFIIRKLIKKSNIAESLFNLLFTLASLASVFYMLDANDPEFKNEDAALMVDYYKGFVMPMLFFPALGWMILKPLFIK